MVSTCSFRRENVSSAASTSCALLRLCTCIFAGWLSCSARPPRCIQVGGCTLTDTSSTPASSISMNAVVTVMRVVQSVGLVSVIFVWYGASATLPVCSAVLLCCFAKARGLR